MKIFNTSPTENLPPTAPANEALQNDAAMEAAFRPALLERAKWLYRVGYTPLASKFKAPNLFRWKDPSRDDIYVKTVIAINRGRANSLNLRLDGELAALDLDFRGARGAELTDAFIDAYRGILGGAQAYTAKGAKGCKIFVMLTDKAEHLKDRYIGETVYPPETDFADADAVAAARCELELKTDVASVYGRHSEKIRYGYYPGTEPIVGTPPRFLPEVDFAMLRLIWKEAVNRAEFVPLGGVAVDAKAKERAFVCVHIAKSIMQCDLSTQMVLMPALRHFLQDFGHGIELAAVDSLQHGHRITRWEGLCRELAQRADEFDGDVFHAFNELFEKDRMRLAQKLSIKKPNKYTFMHLLEYNVLELQNLLEKEQAVHEK